MIIRSIGLIIVITFIQFRIVAQENIYNYSGDLFVITQSFPNGQIAPDVLDTVNCRIFIKVIRNENRIHVNTFYNFIHFNTCFEIRDSIFYNQICENNKNGAYNPYSVSNLALIGILPKFSMRIFEKHHKQDQSEHENEFEEGGRFRKSGHTWNYHDLTSYDYSVNGLLHEDEESAQEISFRANLNIGTSARVRYKEIHYELNIKRIN